jgi:hypothetical protein
VQSKYCLELGHTAHLPPLVFQTRRLLEWEPTMGWNPRLLQESALQRGLVQLRQGSEPTTFYD